MLKRFIFKLTHFFATYLPNKLGITTPYHRLPAEQFCLPADVYIGSILLDAKNSRRYAMYDYQHIVKQCQLAAVVRTVQSYELNTDLWGGVKAPTQKQYEALGVDVIDLPVGDFVNGFSANLTDYVKQLKVTLEELYQLQQQGKSFYIHCKAGKNRSFKTLTAYIVYANHREALWNHSISDDVLKQKIREVGEAIHQIRPQVVYHSQKEKMEHEDFVFHALKGG